MEQNMKFKSLFLVSLSLLSALGLAPVAQAQCVPKPSGIVAWWKAENNGLAAWEAPTARFITELPTVQEKWAKRSPSMVWMTESVCLMQRRFTFPVLFLFRLGLRPQNIR